MFFSCLDGLPLTISNDLGKVIKMRLFSTEHAADLTVLANEDMLLRTHCCRHKFFPVCPRETFVADTKDVSDFVQKHFVSATNVSQFAQPKKHHVL